jgi:SAM-dependent methyltransferase
VNPFATDSMAEGYATARPPVHPRVVEIAQRRVPHPARALDLGCGAGLSTAPLRAEHAIGVEPVEAMLKWTRTTAPHASFAVGAAEALPILSHTVDLVTAAGSLNYVADLGRAFEEIARVLTAAGTLVVYDFSPGRSEALEPWFDQFRRRYPRPDDGARELNPAILAHEAQGFRLEGAEDFAIALPMTPTAYLDYMMTETNVAAAVGRGVPVNDIRAWCAETLAPVFAGDIVFRGYIAWLTRPASH